MKVTTIIENTEGADGCVPLHGLSFFVETDAHRILFDAGPSDEALRNAERLGIDLRTVDMAVLSHGHYDHSGGLPAFAALNPTAKIYMQRRAGGENYAFDGPEKGYRYIGIDKSILNLPQVCLIDGDARIDDEVSLFKVSRRAHPLPSTNKRIVMKSGDGYVQDDFAHEQSMYVRSGGKRVLLAGCAHSGILNIMEAFVDAFGRDELPHAVFGGFHLMRKTGYDDADRAEQLEIARRLREYPCKFYTCHCTGLEPYELMKSVMGDQLAYVHTGESYAVGGF